jgi:hypothetical protein
MASAAEYEDDMREEMNPALRNIPSGVLDVAGSSMPVNFMWLASVALYYLNPDVIGTFEAIPLNTIHPPDFTTSWETIKKHDIYRVIMKNTRHLHAIHSNVYYICIVQKDMEKSILEMAFQINYPNMY